MSLQRQQLGQRGAVLLYNNKGERWVVGYNDIVLPAQIQNRQAIEAAQLSH